MLKISELTVGDRFRAYGALWTFIDYDDDGIHITARKVTKIHPGSNESICSFKKDEEVEFQVPEL